MKILLTGATGQVGWELQRTLRSCGEVISVGRKAIDINSRMDLADPDTIRRIIREVKPDLIINSAAYTAVDKAESEPELAMAVNGIAPGLMASEAKRLGIGMIHYSTDYVFDGMNETAYTEEHEPYPQNIYGKTKLAGEQAIQAVGIPHLILRTSWVYGLRGKNFMLTMLRLAQEREELKVVDDQIGTPNWSGMIAETTTQMLKSVNLNNSDLFASKSGTYHLSASGKTSWYGFAKAIFALSSQSNERKLKKLHPICSSEYPTTAKRPTYSQLNAQKLSDAFGLILPTWKESLELIFESHKTLNVSS